MSRINKIECDFCGVEVGKGEWYFSLTKKQNHSTTGYTLPGITVTSTSMAVNAATIDMCEKCCDKAAEKDVKAPALEAPQDIPADWMPLSQRYGR